MAYMNIYNYDIYTNIQDKNISYTTSMAKEFGMKYVVIDDDIAYVIQTLNKKGYNTRFCCSGHYGYELDEGFECSDSSGGYIFFEEPYVFETLPEGVFQDTSHIIRFKFSANPNTSDRFYELNEIIYALSKWADELPENK